MKTTPTENDGLMCTGPSDRSRGRGRGEGKPPVVSDDTHPHYPTGHAFWRVMRSQAHHSVSTLHNTQESPGIVMQTYKAACASEQVGVVAARFKISFPKMAARKILRPLTGSLVD